ncbi:MAG: LuxR C-terminal-related transcriptional regulator [Sphingomonas sp.]
MIDLDDDRLTRLSERQRQCLELVVQGLTSKQIGRILNLSPSTVDNHLHVAIDRLGAANRAEAARLLRNAGQRSPEGREQALLPPLGGRLNRANLGRRYRYVINVAMFGIMAFAAMTITIAGIVGLFSRK